MKVGWTAIGWLIGGLVVCSACSSPEGPGRSEDDGSVQVLGPADLRIGAVDDPDFAFGRVTDLVVDPAGIIYSLHANEAWVRRWTPNGQPLPQLGGEGQGPGEFSRPAALGFFADTLWVHDTRTYATSLFRTDGAFLSQWTTRVDLGQPGQIVDPPRPRRPLRDGSFLGQSPEWTSRVVDGELTEAPWTVQSADGENLVDLWTKPLSANGWLGLRFGDAQSYSAQPFGDDVIAVSGLDGIFVLERGAAGAEGPAAFRSTKIAYSADTLWQASFPYEPIPLEDELVEAAVDSMSTAMFGWLSEFRPEITESGLRADIREGLYRPDHLPPVRSVLVTAEGAYWIETTLPKGEAESGSEWLVVHGDGAVAGRVRTPVGLRVLHVSEQAVWGVVRDEFDVDYIVRHPREF